MEIEDLADELDEFREHDSDESLRIITAKLGQVSEQEMGMDEAEDIPDDEAAFHRRDLFAGLVISCFEYAAEHDIDVGTAFEERLDLMRERAEERQELQDAIESGDAEAVAEALDADSNEIPPGAFDEDEDDPIGFQ